MSTRYYGKVVGKYRYENILGPAIQLGVVADSGRTQTFENAAWTLEKFAEEDRVTWLEGFGRSLIDPRGTDSLKLVERGKK